MQSATSRCGGFFREARVTAGLSSTNTVRVYDIGQDPDGPLYIAMELLPGKTLHGLLRERLTAGSALTEAETLEIGAQVLNSLAEAHDKKLVHRDLKPGNIILMDEPDGGWLVKVLDFGIARTEDSSLTAAGAAPGTPAFMSPEQCKGDAMDGRSDLYALGILLFACACGRLPFESRDTLQLMHMHLTQAAPDPRSLAKQPLSQGFAAVVLRALAKKPDDRFADAREMRRALLAVANGTWQPDAQAPPESVPPRPPSGAIAAAPVEAPAFSPTVPNVPASTTPSPSVIIQAPVTAEPRPAAPAAATTPPAVAPTAAAAPLPGTARKPAWVLWAGAAVVVAVVAGVVLQNSAEPAVQSAPPAGAAPSSDQQKAKLLADMAAGADSVVKALEFAKEAQRLDPGNADYQKLVERLQQAAALAQQAPAPAAAPAAAPAGSAGAAPTPAPAPTPAAEAKPAEVPTAVKAAASRPKPAAKPADKGLAPKLMTD